MMQGAKSSQELAKIPKGTWVTWVYSMVNPRWDTQSVNPSWPASKKSARQQEQRPPRPGRGGDQ